jgi:hypothetical protein
MASFYEDFNASFDRILTKKKRLLFETASSLAYFYQ